MRSSIVCWALSGNAALLMAQLPLGSLVGGGTAAFGSPTQIPGGLRGGIYAVRGELSKLPDFERTLRIATIYTASLRVSPRPFWEGFPGSVEPLAAFALDYHGEFQVRKAQTYRFSLLSGDGSRLYIDGKLVIDNDGAHDPVEREGSVSLLAASHEMRVSYFHRRGKDVALILQIAEGETGEWRVFDTNEFGLPRAPGAAENQDFDPLDPFEPRFSAPPRNPNAGRLRLGDALNIDSDAMAALEANPKPHQFDFRIAIFQFRNEPLVWQGVLVIELPLSELRSAQSASANLAVLALLKDEQGHLANRLVFGGPLKTGSGPITLTEPLVLDPSLYTVEVAIVDKDGSRVSTGSTLINPGATAVGLSMSDIVLVRKFETGPARRNDPLIHAGQRVIPQLTDSYPADGHPTVFVVVYPDRTNPAKAVLSTELKVDGKSIAKHSTDLATLAKGEAVGLSLEPKVHGGENEILIQVTQGKQSVSGSARFKVESK
jgi:hypothetical protein